MKDNKKLKISNKIGLLGEEIACKFVKNKGYIVLTRNYRENWGEIDIVAEKDKKISFFEVKSVSCEIYDDVSGVTRDFRPEEKVSASKIKKMARIIQSYILDKKVSDETDWDFNVLCVFVDVSKKRSVVKMIENVVVC